MTSRSERAAQKADAKAQEHPTAKDAARRVGRTARTFLHVTHAETGQDVVFLPGELLPEWVELPSDEEAQ